MTVRITLPDDHGPLVTILTEAAKWMKSRGFHQWESNLTDRQRLERGVSGWIDRGEARIAEVGGRAAGMFVLNRGGKWEMDVWVEPNASARYLSKLAIRREFAGQGLGLALLRRAEALASTDGGVRLRLDCAADNPALCAWYDRAGYVRMGEVHAHGFHLLRFETRIPRLV